MEAALRKPSGRADSKRHRKRQDIDNTKMSVSADVYKHLVRQVQAALREVLKEESPPDASIEFKERKRSNNDSETVILMTPVCAAIAGRSMGKLDRGQLCKHVGEILSRNILGTRGSANGSDDPSGNIQAKKRSRSEDDIEEGDAAMGLSQVIKIETHIKSGHILVHVHATQGTSADIANHNQEDPMEEDPTDRLALWWQRRRPSETLSEERKLTVTTLPAHESALDPDVYRLYALYQHKVHGDADPFVAVMVSDEESIDPWTDVWGKKAPWGWRDEVRQVLQQAFQSQDAERKTHLLRHFVQFYEFLVENSYPLGNAQQGTFHQQYRVNGALIAVGVVDVLPQGLSSVYVFYDPDFSHNVAPLGKFTVLREIQWAQEHKLPYYYLGYYIESCVKMRYKADYAPSDLLCPKTATWVPAEEAKRLIKERSPERHCCAFVPEMSDGNSSNDSPIPPTLQLEVGLGRVVSWEELPPEAMTVLEPFVRDFCVEAGPSLSRQVVMDFR